MHIARPLVLTALLLIGGAGSAAADTFYYRGPAPSGLSAGLVQSGGSSQGSSGGSAQPAVTVTCGAFSGITYGQVNYMDSFDTPRQPSAAACLAYCQTALSGIATSNQTFWDYTVGRHICVYATSGNCHIGYYLAGTTPFASSLSSLAYCTP